MTDWEPESEEVVERSRRKIAEDALRANEKQQDLLLELSDLIGEIRDPDELGYAAAEILGRALGVSRVGYSAIDPDAETLHTSKDWCAAGVMSLAGVLQLRDYGSFIESLKRGELISIVDVRLDERTAIAASALESASARSFVNVPVIEQDRLRAVMYVNHAETRVWSSEDLALIRDFARRMRTAIGRLAAEAELRAREERQAFLLALSDATRQVDDPRKVAEVTCRQLAKHMRGSRVQFVLVEGAPGTEVAEVRGEYVETGPPLPRRFPMAPYGEVILAPLRDGQTLVLKDSETDPRLNSEQREAFRLINSPSAIAAPLIKGGRFAGTFTVHDAAARQWTSKEIALVEEVAERTWAAVERTYAENALRETEAAYRHQMAQFFDATTDAIFFLDRNYRFTFLNRRAHELLAPGGEDILGTVLFERYPDTVYRDSPFVSAYTGSMERGEVGDFEAYYPEPFNFWLRVQSYPADHGIIVFFRDITRDRALKKEVEQQLAEIESVYRTAPIGLALFDAKEYRYQRLNDIQASFFGLKAEDVVGKVLTDMAPIEGLRELFDKVAGGEPVVNYPLEGSLSTEPGTHRYWTVNYHPVYGADGSITGISTASLEITNQKKAERALLESEKLAVVGRLAASIAHEINNPLEAVTNLQYLAERSQDPAQTREYLRLAGIELRRVSAITAQTLRFHKQATKPQDVLAEELIEGVLSVFQGRLSNSHVTVFERYRARRTVRCFEGEIRQVLSNLLSNGLDAMGGNGGNLYLRTRLRRRPLDSLAGVVITVADTGGGMTEETLAKLFLPFYTTKGIRGTGLGLWVSKEIVDRHHGTLEVRSSQAPHRSGTVFRLFLPLEAVGT